MKRAAFSALLVASGAFAFVPSAYSILRHVADKRDEQQLFALKVDGSASLTGAAVRDMGPALGLPTDRPELQVDAAFSLKLPRRCRVDLSSADGKPYAASVSNGRRRGDPELRALSVALNEVCGLLAERSSSEADTRSALERHLKALGVHTESTSLGRFGGQIAYVLGDLAEDKPQAWIYKETYLPARVRFSDASKVLWDVRMLDYSSPASGEWFPRTLEVYATGELVFRFTALKADTHVTLPEKLF